MTDTQQPEALKLADDLQLNHEYCDKETLLKSAAELRRLHEENENLRSVMIAAAEEIDSHWNAHCDDDGYGPVNLMHRLEKGIPSQYSYKAGDFERLRLANIDCIAHFNALMADRNELLDALKAMSAEFDNGDVNDGEWAAIQKARAAITKTTG